MYIVVSSNVNVLPYVLLPFCTHAPIWENTTFDYLNYTRADY